MSLLDFVRGILTRVMGKRAPTDIRITYSIPLGGPSDKSVAKKHHEACDKKKTNKP